MKRRGFLQSLVGFVGLAVAPTLPAKTKSTIVNGKPGIYETGIVDTCFNSQFDYLTVDHFGAANTKSLTRIPGPAFFTGMTWYPPAEYFPDASEEGDAFYFTPKTYLGYELDQKTKDRLQFCYIFTTNGWRPMIGISKTEDL